MLTAHEADVYTALRNAIYLLETDGRNGKRRALDALYLIKYSFEPLMRDDAPPVAPPPDALCIDGQHQWSTETGVFNILAPGVERFCTLCGCVEYASPPDALARYAAEMYGENE